MDEFTSSFYKLDGHSIEEYERSHKARLDFLVEDLKLNEIKDSAVGDFGCGYAPIFRRLPKPSESNNYYFGFDGDGSRAAEEFCCYRKVDLNQMIEQGSDLLDVALCFETLEHLSNPYQCLIEIKRILKEEGVLYLSIPHEDCTHNTLYPGLFYPVSNFKEFLGQMAFEIEDHRIHDKCFKQHVFTLRNKPWSFVKMKWVKGEEKFHGKPPHVQVNL